MIAGIQSMRLHRLSAHRDGLKKIRVGLGRRRSAGEKIPHRIQILAWEASQVFLVLSVALMVIGVAVLVWVSTDYGPNKPKENGWWDENSKVRRRPEKLGKAIARANSFEDGCHVHVCSWVCASCAAHFADCFDGDGK